MNRTIQISTLGHAVLTVLLLTLVACALESVSNSRPADCVVKSEAGGATNADAMYVNGLRHMCLREYGPALYALSKSIELKGIKTGADRALIAVHVAWKHYYLERNPMAAITKFKEAESHIDRLLETSLNTKPFYAAVYRVYANSLEETGQIRSALKLYKKAQWLHGKAGANWRINQLTTKIGIDSTMIEARQAQKSGRERDALEQFRRAYVIASRAGFNARQYQELAIKSYLKLDLKPATPEKAVEHISRGLIAIKMATEYKGYEAAANEFQKALEAAPWEPQIYYNMGIVQEKADLLRESIESFKLYLLAAPDATDRKVIKQKIYELGYAKDFQAKRKRELVGTWTIEGKMQSRYTCGSNKGKTWEVDPPVFEIISGNKPDTFVIKVLSTLNRKVPFVWTARGNGPVVIATPPIGEQIRWNLPAILIAHMSLVLKEGRLNIRLLKDFTQVDYLERVEGNHFDGWNHIHKCQSTTFKGKLVKRI